MANPVSSAATTAAVVIGAGLASAILFSLVTQATFLAVALAYLAPLPIMIATIGFGRAVGLPAATVAAVTVGVVAYLRQAQLDGGADAGSAAIASATYAAALAAPSLWLCILAISRPNAPPRDLKSDAPVRTYALERLTANAVAIAAAVGVIATIITTARHGGFSAALDEADSTLTPALESLTAGTSLPQGLDLHRMARLMALAAPPAIAASTLLMLLVNLWLAARAAQISALLAGPWPDIPHELRMPRLFAPALAVAIGAAFIGGLPGLLGAVVAAALAMGFSLQGLAVVHDLSRSFKYRTLLLGALYFSLIALAPPWLLIAFAILGVVESLFSLRDRKRAASQKP